MHPLREYVPGIDSVQTALRFLEQNKNLLSKLSSKQLSKLSEVSEQFRQLQGSLQKANEIQQFIKEREIELKSRLANFRMAKELKGLNKQAVYYQQQLREYKELLKDREKLKTRLMSKIAELPAFKSYMAKNSYLAQLFKLPEDYGSPASLNGLQTKSQVKGLIADKLGGLPSSSGGQSADPGSLVQKQMQQAQEQLKEVQSKVSNLVGGGGGNSDITMPDFKPNAEKTHSFFKRLEYGLNFQTVAPSFLTPMSSNIGLSIGYKLNEKSVMGIGVNYRLGLGKFWDDIHLTNEGIGMRTFIDYKIKWGIWVSGGAEATYMNSFAGINSIKNLDIWQKSALLGLTKKYKITKNRGGNFQVLYDFLYKNHVPWSQPLILRLGFSFK